MFETIIGISCGLIAVGIVFGTLISMCAPIYTPAPMTYDEEIKWLISLGMTEQEAKEIIDNY